MLKGARFDTGRRDGAATDCVLKCLKVLGGEDQTFQSLLEPVPNTGQRCVGEDSSHNLSKGHQNSTGQHNGRGRGQKSVRDKKRARKTDGGREGEREAESVGKLEPSSPPMTADTL